MRRVSIYVLIDPRNQQIRYVGKTVTSLGERLSKHVYDCKLHRRYLSNWIRSLIKEGLLPIIEEIDSTTDSNWGWLEIYWISQFKAWGFNLTNGTPGGQCGSGAKSLVTREKLRQANLGKKYSEETKRKKSESLKLAYSSGRRDPKDYMHKVAKSNSKKNPLNNKNTNAAKRQRFGQYSLEGDLIKEYEYVYIAADEFNIKRSNISYVLKNPYKITGEYKTCGGFIFKLIN